jgi:membrane fusion protein (multidrug efflux system)
VPDAALSATGKDNGGGMKRWLIMLGAVALLVLLIGGIKGFGVYKQMQGFKTQGVPKMTVSTLKATMQEWNPQVAAVGGLRAYNGADLGSEVAGIVDAIEFKSGDDVKAGQPLLRLREADDAAHLESLAAAMAIAQIVYDRDCKQYAAQAVSKAVVDNDAATLRAAKAQVAEQQAVLDKKTIRAPFDGRLGIRAVDLGQYLAAGTKVVSLQQLDPLYVDFFVPQQSLGRLAVGQKVSATIDAFAGRQFAGEIAAIEPIVDANTRNVQVRATLHNPDRKLVPGMYATVSVDAGAAERYVTVPQTAVSYNPYGATVFLVGHGQADVKAAAPAGAGAADLLARQVFVTVGPTRGDQVAIVKGVAAGDEVVTSGQIKLRNGTPIAINNSVVPANDASPSPQEN